MTNPLCANCGNSFEGKFCNRCGQKSIGRFTAAYLWRGIAEDLFGVERGLVYTFRELWLRPGSTIGDYLKGATARYYSPLKYLIFWAAIYLVSLPFIGQREVSSPLISTLIENASLYGETLGNFVVFLTRFMTQKSDLYFLGAIPFLSVVTWMVFKASKYNLTEIVIFYTYFYGQFAFCAITVNLISQVPGLPGTVSDMLLHGSYLFLIFRMQKGFFSENWVATLTKGTAVFLLGTAFYWVVVFLGFMGVKIVGE